MDKTIFPDWFQKLDSYVQHILQYGEQNPFKYVYYICHLSPDEIREACTDPQLRGMLIFADLSNQNEVEEQVRILMRRASWLRDTEYKSEGFEELQHYVLIRCYGNKPVVIHRKPNGEIVHQSLADFKNSHVDRFIMTEDHKTGDWIRVSLPKAWLLSTTTPKFEYAEFIPGIEQYDMPENIFNLWQGWPFNPDKTIDQAGEPEACQKFLDHIFQNVCGKDLDVYSYLLGWMADALQNPNRTSEVAIVMRGPQGSGKTFWAKYFMELFSPHTLTLDKPNQVTGNFNKHLQDVCIVFADEAFFAGNRQHAATLKTLITGEQIFIEPKGVDGFMAPKIFRMIIASNDEHVIRAEIDDRRYLVLDVNAGDNNQNHKYFNAIDEEWKNGGKEALFRWLQGEHWQEMLELGHWNVRSRPKTKALQKQKDLSLPPTQAIIQQMLHDGELPDLYDVDRNNGNVFVATRLLATRGRLSPKDETALGQFMRALTDKNSENVRIYLGDKYQRKQYRGFWLPPLDVCRTRWEVHLNRSIEWPKDVNDWGIEDARSPNDVIEAPF